MDPVKTKRRRRAWVWRKWRSRSRSWITAAAPSLRFRFLSIKGNSSHRKNNPDRLVVDDLQDVCHGVRKERLPIVSGRGESDFTESLGEQRRPQLDGLLFDSDQSRQRCTDGVVDRSNELGHAVNFFEVLIEGHEPLAPLLVHLEHDMCLADPPFCAQYETLAVQYFPVPGDLALPTDDVDDREATSWVDLQIMMFHRQIIRQKNSYVKYFVRTNVCINFIELSKIKAIWTDSRVVNSYSLSAHAVLGVVSLDTGLVLDALVVLDQFGGPPDRRGRLGRVRGCPT